MRQTRVTGSYFMRLLGATYLGQRMLSRWAKRRFTTNGLLVGLGMVLTIGTASTEQTMGFAAFLVLSSMWVMALLIAPFFRGRFTIERHVPRLATAGERFTVSVRLHNASGRVQGGLEYLEDLRDPRLSAQDVARRLRIGFAGGLPYSIRSAKVSPQSLPVLLPDARCDIEVGITAFRRGPLVLAAGVVARTDPFGLFRAVIRIPSAQTVLVMPRRYPLPPLALPGQAQHQQGGVALASSVGESEEVISLREYRRGDPMKRVHWRSTARTGRLVVKEFQDEWFVRHALVLDTFCPPQHDEQFEEAVAVAASFACTIPDQESLLDLLLVGTTAVCVTSGRGLGHTQQMLEVLAAVKPSRDPRLDALETLVLQHRAALSGCVLVLLAWDEPRRALVKRLKAMCLPVLVLLVRGSGEREPIERGAPEEQPDRMILLEAGRIGEDLQQLGHQPCV